MLQAEARAAELVALAQNMVTPQLTESIKNYTLAVNILIHYYKYYKEHEVYNSDSSTNKLNLKKFLGDIFNSIGEIDPSFSSDARAVKKLLTTVPKLLIHLGKKTKFNKLYHLITTDYNTYKEMLKELNNSLDPITILRDDEEPAAARWSVDPPPLSFSKIIEKMDIKLKALDDLLNRTITGRRRGISKPLVLIRALRETLFLP